MTEDTRLERYAELVVRVGANVAEGQLVSVIGQVEHAPLVRALTRASYGAGARYVDVFYFDQHVRRAMIERGPDEALTWTPPWLLERWRRLGDERGAVIGVTGDPDPELFADLDGERVGRALMIELSTEGLRHVNERLVNWTGVAFPNEGWARTVFGEPDVERLWDAVAFAVRLDEPDPVAAWDEHVRNLTARAAELNERRFDAVRFRGPGSDLTVRCGAPRPRRRSGGGSTCRTCRPRRCSRPRIRRGRRASCARRGRSLFRGTSSATSRSGSRAAARWR